MYAFVFVVAFNASYDTNLGPLNLCAIVYMWVIGAMRMDDTKHSNAWAIFAPSLIGTIIIGCLKSAPKTEELSC